MKVSAIGRLYFLSCGVVVGCAETMNYPYLQDLEEDVHDQVNEHRVEQGLEPLALMESFSEVARDHSEVMAEAGYLDHGDFEARALELSLTSPDLHRVGENLGLADPDELAEAIVFDWVDSPEHAVNLVGDFEQTGVGAFEAEDGTVYITQLYLGFGS